MVEPQHGKGIFNVTVTDQPAEVRILLRAFHFVTTDLLIGFVLKLYMLGNFACVFAVF